MFKKIIVMAIFILLIFRGYSLEQLTSEVEVLNPKNGEYLTVKGNNVSVNDILIEISRKCNLEMVISDSVSYKLNHILFSDIYYEKIIEILCKLANVEYRLLGSVYYICSKDEWNNYDYSYAKNNLVSFRVMVQPVEVVKVLRKYFGTPIEFSYDNNQKLIFVKNASNRDLDRISKLIRTNNVLISYRLNGLLSFTGKDNQLKEICKFQYLTQYPTKLLLKDSKNDIKLEFNHSLGENLELSNVILEGIYNDNKFSFFNSSSSIKNRITCLNQTKNNKIFLDLERIYRSSDNLNLHDKYEKYFTSENYAISINSMPDYLPIEPSEKSKTLMTKEYENILFVDLFKSLIPDSNGNLAIDLKNQYKFRFCRIDEKQSYYRLLEITHRFFVIDYRVIGNTVILRDSTNSINFMDGFDVGESKTFSLTNLSIDKLLEIFQPFNNFSSFIKADLINAIIVSGTAVELDSLGKLIKICDKPLFKVKYCLNLQKINIHGETQEISTNIITSQNNYCETNLSDPQIKIQIKPDINTFFANTELKLQINWDKTEIYYEGHIRNFYQEKNQIIKFITSSGEKILIYLTCDLILPQIEELNLE